MINKVSFLGIFAKVSAIMLVSSVSHAGVGSSGGGLAVVCRMSTGQIAAAELLDLYEARTVFGYSVVPATGSLQRDYYLAAANTYRLQGYPGLAEQERANIAENLQHFFDRVKMTRTGERLPALPDFGAVPALPQGCALEQLAVFYDENPVRIAIDSEIWRALDSVNQSALVTHETFYYWERQMQERTSESTRAFVAHVYANGGVEPVHAGVPRGALECHSIDSRIDEIASRESGYGRARSYNSRLSIFSAYPVMTARGMGTRLQFSNIADRPIIAKTTVDLPGVNFSVKKAVASVNGEMSMTPVVDEPDKNVQVELPFATGLRKDWTIEISYVTGLPVKLVIKQKGVPISEEYVTACIQK
jgi:hypothetical protein